MSAFIDVRCQKCGKRYGWLQANLTDWKPCPECGYSPPKSEIENDAKEMRKAMRQLKELSKRRKRKDK